MFAVGERCGCTRRSADGGKKRQQATRLECFERRGATWRGAHSVGWVLAKREAFVPKACPGFLGEPWAHEYYVPSVRNAWRIASRPHAAVSQLWPNCVSPRLTGGATRKIHSKEIGGLLLQTTVYTSQSHSLGRFPVFHPPPPPPPFVPGSHLTLFWATRANCCAFLL